MDNNINYQPLAEMSDVWKYVLKKFFGVKNLLLFILLVAATVFASLHVDPSFPCFALLFGYIWWLSAIYKQKQNKVWKNFAHANGWMVEKAKKAEDVTPPSVEFGHSRKASPVINAVLSGSNTKLFSYECTTGVGKNSTTYYFTVAAMELPEVMPHILLRSKKGGAGVGESVNNDVKLQLEGKFNDYFDLRMEKGQQIDVLCILTPDVMEHLIAYNLKEDIELHDNYLYMIVSGNSREVENVKQLIDSICNLSKEIKDNIIVTKRELLQQAQ